MKVSDLSNDVISEIDTLVQYIKKSVSVIDPFVICQKFGIDYCFIDIDEPLAYNHFNPLKNRYDIYISGNVDKYSAKILCYHELGHILRERSQYVSLFNHEIDPESEFYANYFTSQFLPIFSRQTITQDTNIEAINEYVTCQIRRKSQAAVMPGQLTLFDFIDLNSDFWIAPTKSFYKKNN